MQLSLVNFKSIKTNPTPPQNPYKKTLQKQTKQNDPSPPKNKIKTMQKKDPNIVIQNNLRISSDK